MLYRLENWMIGGPFGCAGLPLRPGLRWVRTRRSGSKCTNMRTFAATMVFTALRGHGPT
jgi:hypothetical protein